MFRTRAFPLSIEKGVIHFVLTNLEKQIGSLGFLGVDFVNLIRQILESPVAIHLDHHKLRAISLIPPLADISQEVLKAAENSEIFRNCGRAISGFLSPSRKQFLERRTVFLSKISTENFQLPKLSKPPFEFFRKVSQAFKASRQKETNFSESLDLFQEAEDFSNYIGMSKIILSNPRTQPSLSLDFSERIQLAPSHNDLLTLVSESRYSSMRLSLSSQQLTQNELLILASHLNIPSHNIANFHDEIFLFVMRAKQKFFIPAYSLTDQLMLKNAKLAMMIISACDDPYLDIYAGKKMLTEGNVRRREPRVSEDMLMRLARLKKRKDVLLMIINFENKLRTLANLEH